jgi:hypothetical protein
MWRAAFSKLTVPITFITNMMAEIQLIEIDFFVLIQIVFILA